MTDKPSPPDIPTPNIQGEGDHVSGRAFQKAQHEFAEHGPVDEAAKAAAAALDGPEAEELERARLESAKGEPAGAKKPA